MKKWLASATAALLTACVSCGGSSKLYPVSGSVAYKGQPAAGAFVFLRRQGGDPLNDQTMMGLVQGDGTFTVVCGAQGKGAPPGEYDVLIEWRQVLHPSRGLAQRGQGTDRLKGRYADPNHPLIRVTIKPGRNDLAPFDLTD